MEAEAILQFVEYAFFCRIFSITFTVSENCSTMQTVLDIYGIYARYQELMASDRFHTNTSTNSTLYHI